MEQNSAAENLHVIRTLMERAALYRRTLAPIMFFVGTVGVVACAGGLGLKIEETRTFALWWLGAAAVAVAGAYLIARLQALKDREPFWSPPTRRVTQAIVPPLMAGLCLSAPVLLLNPEDMRWLFIFPNALFYGCAVHAAGFFMPRGMKLFGWLIIVSAGLTWPLLPVFQTDPNPQCDHLLMGCLFGVLHLAYGVYLRVTEQGKTAA